MPTVVFIHGINSTCRSAFGETLTDFANGFLGREDWKVATYDYDWRQPIFDSASGLVSALQYSQGRTRKDVVIIAHSMGGLVARRAVMAGAAVLVRRLIMLGTPNFGAFSAVQLGLLSQPLGARVAGFIGQYLRAPGVRDLTQIPALFSAAHATPVATEYVTIPGTYFHEYRPWQIAGDASAAQRFFGRVAIAGELVAALDPLLKIRLARPHDGIVENNSCCISPSSAGRRSEKDGSINTAASSKKTYVHLMPPTCDDLTHVDLPRDPKIRYLLKELVLLESLSAYVKGLTYSTRW